MSFMEWIGLRLDERRAQVGQNTSDHDFYDGDPTYSTTESMLDVSNPNGGGAPGGFGPSEVRDWDEAPEHADMMVQGDVGDPGEHGVWDSDEGSPRHRAERVRVHQADIAIHHPERYFDVSGPADGLMTNFYPEETVEGGDGEWRYDDADSAGYGSEPRGRTDQVLHPETDGANDPPGSFDGQTPFGFQQHEAEGGQTLRSLEGPGKDSTVMDSSPDDGNPDEWMGRASSLRSAVSVSRRTLEAKREPWMAAFQRNLDQAITRTQQILRGRTWEPEELRRQREEALQRAIANINAGNLEAAKFDIQEGRPLDFAHPLSMLIDSIEEYNDFYVYPETNPVDLAEYEDAVSGIGTTDDVRGLDPEEGTTVEFQGQQYTVTSFRSIAGECRECDGSGQTSVEVECPYCDGSGQGDSTRCEDCDGDGRIVRGVCRNCQRSVEWPADSSNIDKDEEGRYVVNCPYCNSGRNDSVLLQPGTFICNSCGGSGSSDSEHCDHCDGSGEVSDTDMCSSCRGSGEEDSDANGRIVAFNPNGQRVVGIEWHTTKDGQGNEVPYVWGGSSAEGRGKNNPRLITTLGRAMADLYRKTVSPRLIVAGPFTPAGYAFSKMFADEMVGSPAAVRRTARVRVHAGTAGQVCQVPGREE